MKLAVSGKGGIGKTTFSALLAKHYAKNGSQIIAIDADPDANLANALGFPAGQPVTPLVELRDLIKERVGAEPGQTASYFTMNPKVDDIPDKYSIEKDGVKLMAMGTVRRGGGGCVCPENVIVRSLIGHLLIHRDDVVLLDMEAGVEHLGRGTARFVDVLLVVVGPTIASIQTFRRIKKLASDLNMGNIAVVANQVKSEDDIERIKTETGATVIGAIPFSPDLIDYHGGDVGDSIHNEIERIVQSLNNDFEKAKTLKEL
ncbi:MAG: AAA family ATPase [Fibrobacteria bacterium]|nr:AAA family ATPase [Fibrobacteria bacterium]